MIGQATEAPRPATPAEQAAWQRHIKIWQAANKTTVGVEALANLAANIQSWGDSIGAPIAAMTMASAHEVRAILDRHNKLSRVVQGIKSDKYYVSLQRGDIAVFAPPGMPAEQYEQDKLGIAWVPILIGVIIVSALITADQALELSATKKSNALKRDIIKADQAMAVSDPDTRRAWLDYKKVNREIFRDADKKSGGGLFDKLFGAGTGSSIAIIAALAIGIIAFSRFGSSEGLRVISPRRHRPRPFTNECKTRPGDLPPDDWAVTWSKEPKKADNQLNRIIDRLGSPKHMEKWRDYFAYGTGHTGPVVVEEYTEY